MFQKILTDINLGKRSLERPKHRYKENVKTS